MSRTWESLALRVEHLERQIEDLKLEQEEMDEESDAWYETECHIESLECDLYEAQGELG